MTNFDKIKAMSVDEMAAYFASKRGFPSSPCYVCQHNEGLFCVNPVVCTEEYKTEVYKEWLEK